MKKIYEVKGMMEWHPIFAVGRARIQVSFTGGHLGDGCCTPAKYASSDPVVQRVIEGSVHFRTGRIKLATIFDEPASETPVRLIDMEFDDYMKAALFLQDEKGVDKKLLTENDSIVSEAKKCGIHLIIKQRYDLFS